MFSLVIGFGGSWLVLLQILSLRSLSLPVLAAIERGREYIIILSKHALVH